MAKKKIVGLSFRKGAKVYDFDPGELELEKGDVVIVETVEGIEAGEIRYTEHEINEGKIESPLKKIIRKASEDDLKKLDGMNKKRDETLKIFKKAIKKYKLPMKTVDVNFSFDDKKITFFFVSETRVDFRELVKELAHNFKKQIILRQIGPRDQAKFLDGYGVCGQPLCCARFLKDLESIVMDMVRDQDLASKGSTKLSGACGRLMCCLAFEAEDYKKLSQKLPALGSIVNTEKGKGKVLSRDILRQTIEIEIDNKGKGERVEVTLSEMKKKGK